MPSFYQYFSFHYGGGFLYFQALKEPNFSVAYANLCRVMSTVIFLFLSFSSLLGLSMSLTAIPSFVQTKVEVMKVEDGKETQGHTTFRRELLTKCQREFEKDKKDDEEREKMLAAINAAETVS